MQLTYFEDIRIGWKGHSGEYVIAKEELIAFARKWDPLPMHTDETAARESLHQGLIAPACYTMAVASRLLSEIEPRPAAIGGAGYDQFRLPNPVRPGDRLSLTVECIGKKPSRTKPDRGVMRCLIIMTNQDDQRVLSYESITMVTKRKPGIE